jgi:site-specific DNA-methyltransferase (adenine-specific)
MKRDGQYQLVFGDGSDMKILRNGEVDLVFTGPPYFSDATEELVKKPVRDQVELSRVKHEITSFALGLRPVYEEVRRILRPGGYLIIQIKDIHYAGVLISLVALHREMAESTGFNLLGRVFCHKFNQRSSIRRFLDHPVVGTFRTDEVEEILIFSDQECDNRAHGLVEMRGDELKKISSPLWVMAPASSRREHPHKAPKAMVRRMISLFTEPGDLVVDPFSGSGTTLAMAVEMGRRTVGYEIEERYATIADHSVSQSIKDKRKAES